MNIIPGMNATASALDAQKIRLEAVAQNIANASTTRGPDGQPYARQMVSFSAVMDNIGRSAVRVDGISKDESPGDLIFNPAHPHANEEGMVRMPNVKMSVEMVDMISASRAYEANLSVAKTARQMASKALEIGRS